MGHFFDGKGGSIASKVVHFCDRPNMGRFGDEIYPFIESILQNGIPKLLRAKNAHLARKNHNYVPDLKRIRPKVINASYIAKLVKIYCL